MNLEVSQIFQLSVAIIGAILILVAAYGAPLRVSVGILLVLIPFQPIETRFGSANILMTYVLFGALVLRGRLRYLPMLGPMLLVLLAYLVTISQLHREMYFDHGLHLFFIISGFLVFVLAYNMAREIENPRYIVNLLIVSNVIAIAYCLIQFTVPPGERMLFFGMDELWMHRNRGGGDPRLIGPFGAAEVTASYFMTMTVLLAYEILHSTNRRRVILATIAIANLAMIFGTASRGAFLILIASMLGFLILFRREIGILRTIRILIVSTVALSGTGALVASHTEFGNMFSRLEQVSFEGGIPDTRRIVWPSAWAAIQEKPWLGHGPFLLSEHTLERSGRTVHREQLVMEYPHNLYLHLLLTLGILGTACFLYFLFAATWRIFVGANRGQYHSDYERGLVFAGLLVVGGFLVHELIIEFLRHTTMDYVHFRLALFGIFVGLADRAKSGMSVPAATEEPVPTDRSISFANSGRLAHAAPARGVTADTANSLSGPR